MTLRDATAEIGRLRSALGPKLAELPAPIVELRLEAVELAEHTGQQLALVEPAGEENVVRLREGLRQVRASTGSGSVCAVVEVAPWSRVPEARALVVPRDDMTPGRLSRRAGRIPVAASDSFARRHIAVAIAGGRTGLAGEPWVPRAGGALVVPRDD